jgi:GT2 family glycosyltransferase
VSLAPRCVAVMPTVIAGHELAAALDCMGPAWREVTVVVANGAPPDVVAGMRRRFPDVRFVSLGANRGFAAAVNHGIALAATPGTDIAVVLNDDVYAPPQALERLVQTLLDDSRAGAAAGVLLEGDSPRIDTAGVRCDPSLGSRDVGKGLTLDQLDNREAPVGPSGGLAAYRLSALAEVGGFDERFFAYYEDLDLALRRSAGAAAARQ